MKTLSLTDGTNTFQWDNVNAVVKSHEGFEYPTVRAVIEDIPSRDGANYIVSRFGRRRLAWAGEWLGDTDVFDMRQDAIKVMTQKGLKTLKVTTYDDLALQAEVEVVKINAPYKKAVHEHLIETIAPDYRLFSQTLQTHTTAVTRLVGGTEIPAEIPLSLSITSGTTKLNITNNGTVKSPPVFTVKGPGTNFVIQNQTTGDLLRLNLTLTATEQVVINVLNRTATKGTNQNVFGSIRGDLWEVPTGSSVIHFNAASGTDGNTMLTVAFRDAYLGV